MPKFDKTRRETSVSTTKPDSVPGMVESRCNVCKSQYRKAIDKMIAMGTSYVEISRIFSTEEKSIDRRSISTHAEKHLNYEEAAIRRIVEREAQEAQQDIEEGVQGALTRRVYLNVGLQKALEGLLSGESIVEPKDAIAIIQLLDKLDGQAEGAALEEMRVQFQAFVQAIREELPPEAWQKILDRTKEILSNTSIANYTLEQPPDPSDS